MNERARVRAPVLVASFVALLAAAARADDVTASEGLGLDGATAIERALAAHPGYRASVLEMRRARARVRAELSRYTLVLQLEGSASGGNTPSLQFDRSVGFPYGENVLLAAELRAPFDTGTTLALRAAGTRTFRRSVFSFQAGMAPIVAELGPGYGLDVTLTVTQPLLRGFGVEVGRAELRSAEAELRTTEARRARRATELVRDTLAAYAELWYAEEAVAIDRAARDLAERQRAEALARVEIGVLTRPATLALSTRLATLEELLAVAEADRRSRAVLLATLLGLPLGTELHATREPPPLAVSVSDAEAVRLAVERAPLLEELAAELEGIRRAASLAGEPLRPRLDAQAQLGLHGVGYDDVPEALAQVGRFAAFTATVGLVYQSPFDDGRQRAEEERARLAVEVAQARLDEARATIEQQVMALLEQRRAARRRIELATETAALARENAEAERGRLELGTRTPIALLVAQEDLRSAELRLRRARTDAYVAEVSLLALTGMLLDGVSLPE